jgi:hypothetical protein
MTSSVNTCLSDVALYIYIAYCFPCYVLECGGRNTGVDIIRNIYFLVLFITIKSSNVDNIETFEDIT